MSQVKKLADRSQRTEEWVSSFSIFQGRVADRQTFGRRKCGARIDAYRRVTTELPDYKTRQPISASRTALVFQQCLDAISQTVEPSYTRQRRSDVVKFYDMCTRLPYDLLLMVLSHLRWVDVNALKTMMPRRPRLHIGPCTAPDLRQTLVHVTQDIRAVLEQSSGSHHRATVNNQYVNEFAFLQRDLSIMRSGTYPTSQRILRMYNSSENAQTCLKELAKMYNTTTMATQALQTAFPILKQTQLIQNALLYMLSWARAAGQQTVSTQLVWDQLTWLPSSFREDVTNFFDNLDTVLTSTEPFPYPIPCHDHNCYLLFRPHPRRITPAQCERCSANLCWWDLPLHIEEELHALGITKALARAFAVHKIQNLLHDISVHVSGDYANLHDPLADQSFSTYFQLDEFDRGLWAEFTRDAQVIRHPMGVHGEIMMVFPSARLRVQITGKRGEGLIDILTYRGESYVHHAYSAWMMEEALQERDGWDRFVLRDWASDRSVSMGCLAQFERTAYWDVMDRAEGFEGLGCLFE